MAVVKSKKYANVGVGVRSWSERRGRSMHRAWSEKMLLLVILGKSAEIGIHDLARLGEGID